MKIIYLAGPLYTEGERILLESIDKLCKEKGFSTYLPHKDGGLFTRKEKSSKDFFINDLKKLDEASLIIVVFNGPDVDSGTSWEMGYFFSKGRPIIGYLNDTRIYDQVKQLNPMIINSSDRVVNNLEGLKKILGQMKNGKINNKKT